MKFYKVYEILDNTEEELESYPRYFVGAFKEEIGAKQLCKIIDIADCNSTKIEYGEIIEQDVRDLFVYGLKGGDCLKELAILIKRYHPINDDELIK